VRLDPSNQLVRLAQADQVFVELTGDKVPQAGISMFVFGAFKEFPEGI
jgi:hypothetical protein